MKIELDIFTMAIGSLISVLMSIIPGFKPWYKSLTGEWKALFTVGVALAVSAAIFGLSCANLFAWVTCDKDGALGLVQVFVSYILANQVTYVLTPTAVKK